ncbi:MAG: putative addiction module antidote protein [Eggerthellaceae bacterium]|nr:putative addiction module antidote protein [Eggerthellaceae bacterium]
MMKKATPWDPAEYLETEEDITAYLNAALEENDEELLRAVLGDIARAKGMTKMARATGVTRDGLYKALSPEGNPSFVTVWKLLAALGMQLRVVPA